MKGNKGQKGREFDSVSTVVGEVLYTHDGGATGVRMKND